MSSSIYSDRPITNTREVAIKTGSKAEEVAAQAKSGHFSSITSIMSGLFSTAVKICDYSSTETQEQTEQHESYLNKVWSGSKNTAAASASFSLDAARCGVATMAAFWHVTEVPAHALRAKFSAEGVAKLCTSGS